MDTPEKLTINISIEDKKILQADADRLRLALSSYCRYLLFKDKIKTKNEEDIGF